MPEGDTIHAIARALGPDLTGKTLALLEVDQRAVPWGPGTVVGACDAVGKHLVVRLDAAVGVRWLRVHLGMKGSWHRYRPGERWARAPSSRRLVIATDEWLFVCFGPKEVVLDVRAEVRHLGPDLLGDAPDIDQILARARVNDRPLGELLLAQNVASGIGNVYKSESLFLAGLDPWRAASAIDDARLGALYRRASELMRVNLERGGARATTDIGDGAPRALGYWVYRRAGMPCRRCGSPIESRLQGIEARMTYWCPRCQG